MWSNIFFDASYLFFVIDTGSLKTAVHTTPLSSRKINTERTQRDNKNLSGRSSLEYGPCKFRIWTEWQLVSAFVVLDLLIVIVIALQISFHPVCLFLSWITKAERAIGDSECNVYIYIYIYIYRCMYIHYTLLESGCGCKKYFWEGWCDIWNSGSKF
jgi:hypothetical protein